MDHRQHSAFPELPQQIAALYEWFSARCRWKEKALTQRGLLVQAGDQSEQILPAGVLGRITPGRCLGAVLSFWRSCAGGHLAMPAVWEARKRWRCCWVICSRKRHNIWQSINAAPTTRHYYHQWFASSTVPTGGEHADFKLAGKVDHGR